MVGILGTDRWLKGKLKIEVITLFSRVLAKEAPVKEQVSKSPHYTDEIEMQAKTTLFLWWMVLLTRERALFGGNRLAYTNCMRAAHSIHQFFYCWTII